MPKLFSLDKSMMGAMAWTPMHQKKLESLITSGFQALGNEVFIESQKRVPVITGNLKRSGSITLPPDGFEITYTETYANDVEVGRRSSTGAVSSQPWVSNIPAHTRKSRTKGRVHVKKHTKTYLKSKPVQMPDGQWRTFSTSSVSRGAYFVGGALHALLTGSLSTNNGFQKYLRTDTI